jgi:DNA polymerase III epsilon subunit-like protein
MNHQVYLDFETTGLNKNQARIVQIGAVYVTDDRITKQFDSLIKPDIPMTAGAMKVTGIKNSDLVGEKACDRVLRDFIKWLQPDNHRDRVVLIAYNGFKFDFPILTAECKRNGIGMSRNLGFVVGFHDPYVWAKNEWPNRFQTPRLTLESAYHTVFGKTFDNAHSALADSVAMAKLCRHRQFADMFLCKHGYLLFSEGVRKWLKSISVKRSTTLLSRKSFSIVKLTK